jgi:mRNA-degrading endonuclease RelE of RelBE toxin-antitoxin system
MTWSVGFTRDALSFLKKNVRLSEREVIVFIQGAIRTFQGERTSINIKKLKGDWRGFYRIRKGNLRIIAAFDFEHRSVLIENIDWRGSAYK